MPELSSLVLAASTVEVIGTVIALLLVAGFVIYALFNIRAGREEVGAEIELAPNLKPYYDDDELETRKLDRTLTFGLATLAIVGIGLPAYWLAEPGRQDGAVEEYERVFASRGEELYTTGAGCNACHGPEGVGGVAPYTILNEDSEFVAQVEWKAPALDTVMLRYDREEVTYILNYGRAFSPMPAWGVPGGGPLTEQQIKNLVDYLDEITISPDQAREAVEGELRTQLDLAEGEEIDYSSLETGEALFNLGEESGFAGGAYACGRCHTRGWSISQDSVQPAGTDVSEYLDYPDGAGAFGPALDGVIPRQFPSIQALVDFLVLGSERGVAYGFSGMGDGNMPGFGDNPNTDEVDDGMLTREMIEAIARYVDSLEGETDNEPIGNVADAEDPIDEPSEQDSDAEQAGA